MLSKFFIVLLLVISCIRAQAELAFLNITNNLTGETKHYTLTKKITIPLKNLSGWRSCIADDPKSKYIKEFQSHVRQYQVVCIAESGVAIDMVCALPDGKNQSDSATVTLHSKNLVENESVFLNLVCTR